MIALREPQAATTAIATTERRYELDWLRAFVVLCVIVYHVMGIFAAGANLYLHESAVELPLNVPSAFFNAWAIPLLFAISGAAAFLALSSHSAADYLRSRVARLLVPFLFGTLLLVPLQVYGVLLSDPGLLRLNLVPISDPHLLDNYPHFYLQYLLSYWYFLAHYSPQLEFVFWGHLWFIARLIVCAVATLPLLLLLNTGPGKRLIGLITRVLLWPPALLLPGLLLGAVIVVLRQPWAQPPLGSWATLDRAQFAVLVLCYLVGYALYADPRGVRAIERAGLLPLFVGIVAFVVLIGFNWGAFPGQLGVDLRRMTEGMVDWAGCLLSSSALASAPSRARAVCSPTSMKAPTRSTCCTCRCWSRSRGSCCHWRRPLLSKSCCCSSGPSR